MIDGRVIDGDEAIAGFERKIPLARQALTRTIKALGFKLQRRVKLKLTDDVLKVRSGRLRRSINVRFEGEGTEKVSAFVGTNLPYGRTHEFGEAVTVKEHLRLVRKAFGKELKTPVWATVRTHVVKYPERSFLRSALREMEPEIKLDIDKAIKEAFK